MCLRQVKGVACHLESACSDSLDAQELMAEWGKGKEEISLQELQPAMNQIGIPPIRSEQFFIDCSG